MKYLFVCLLTFSVVFYASPTPVYAHGGFDTVHFNEVAWMGTTESSNNEWIELYNPTSIPVDVTGWTIQALDGSPNIILKGVIPAYRFFMLERTSEDTLPTLADQIYTGSLNNDGERLQLLDASNVLIDDITHWEAGDNEQKITMALDENHMWQYGVVDGTPNAPNQFLSFAQTNNPNAGSLETAEQGIVANAPIWLGVIVIFFVVGFIVMFVLPHTHPRPHKKNDDEV